MLAAVLITLLSFCGAIIVLAISPEKWQTFKTMLGALIIAFSFVFIVGMTVAFLLPSLRIAMAVLTGRLWLPVGLLAGTQVRSLNNSKN